MIKLKNEEHISFYVEIVQYKYQIQNFNLRKKECDSR